MRTFDQLSLEKKEEALKFTFFELVTNISDGTIEVTLVNPVTQGKLEKILSESRKKESIRYAVLSMLADKEIRPELERLAFIAASGSSYNEEGNPII